MGKTEVGTEGALYIRRQRISEFGRKGGSLASIEWISPVSQFTRRYRHSWVQFAVGCRSTNASSPFQGMSTETPGNFSLVPCGTISSAVYATASAASSGVKWAETIETHS